MIGFLGQALLVLPSTPISKGRGVRLAVNEMQVDLHITYWIL